LDALAVEATVDLERDAFFSFALTEAGTADLEREAT